MNIWLLAIGVVGVAAAGVWYAVLLNDWSPGLRVPFFSRGGMPTRSMYLWLLTVLLSESFVVNAFDDVRGGFSIVGGAAVAFVLSELGRWWHNRTVPAVAAEPPAEWFPGQEPGGGPADRPDGP